MNTSNDYFNISIIDLGTVSTRFDIYQIAKYEKPKILCREKVMQRIGEELFNTGLISKTAIERNIESFKKHLETCKEFNVQKNIAVGTSALRVAKNSEEFIRRLFEETDINLRVISGAEEASLIAKGVIANEEISESCAFVDIGGGSTEISVYKKDTSEIVFAKSFELGASRLQEVFLKKSPPEKESVISLIHHCKNSLSELTEFNVNRIIGSSGTIRSLIKLTNDNNGEITEAAREKIEQTIKKLVPLNRNELLNTPGMEENRVDIILAGSLLFQEIMKATNCQVVQRTLFSLRHGLIQEEIERL